jgi:hypothetical protein
MIKKYLSGIFLSFLLLIVGATLWRCNNSVESSPQPGILRVTLQADPSDTTVVIVKDTFNVAQNDSFGITIFQGRAFHDTNFAVLYPRLHSTMQTDVNYNIIEKESDSYQQYVIFDTYVPPFHYDHIQFGVRSNVIKFSGFDEIQVNLPPGANPLIDLKQNFTISENKVTEINVQIKPFQSVQRYRDTYQFFPQLEVTDINYY